MSEKRIYNVECIDRDGNLRRLIEYIGQIGNTGHSFSIIVDPDSDDEKAFGWDGDGVDRIISVKVKQIAQDSAKTKPKNFKRFIDLLQQIIPLVPVANDGGPGSGGNKMINSHLTIYNSQEGTIRGHGPKQDSVNKRA